MSQVDLFTPAVSQNEQILAYLKTGHSLTPLEALRNFGCFRLGARIHNLKAQGYAIKTETVFAGGKRFARYSL